jgi:hypothetical protein
MKDQKLTRRQIVKVLGMELPIALIAVQIAPKSAFGQNARRLVFQMDRDRLLAIMSNPDNYFEFSPWWDANGAMVGGKIEKVPVEVASETGRMRMNLNQVIVRSLNGKTFDTGTDEAIMADFARMRQLVEAGTPLALDVEIDGAPYQYEIRYR